MKYRLNLGGDAHGTWRVACPRFSRCHVSIAGYIGAYRGDA